jgi:hypothetical protein
VVTDVAAAIYGTEFGCANQSRQLKAVDSEKHGEPAQLVLDSCSI